MRLRTTVSCLLGGLAFLLCLPAVVSAQTAPLQYHTESVTHYSGFQGNLGSTARTAYREVVTVPGAPWLRLQFEDVSLGRSSYLTVTSLADGAEQRLDAAALAQWQNTTAFFNGDALEVALHVGAGDTDAYVRVSEVMVGEYGAIESQCGSTDNRVPSSNPAAGRLLSIGMHGMDRRRRQTRQRRPLPPVIVRGQHGAVQRAALAGRRDAPAPWSSRPVRG